MTHENQPVRSLEVRDPVCGKREEPHPPNMDYCLRQDNAMILLSWDLVRSWLPRNIHA